MLRLSGKPHGVPSSSCWDDLESLLYVLWRLHLGKRPWPASTLKRKHSSPQGSGCSKAADEWAMLDAKQTWLCPPAASGLPAPIERARALVGQRWQRLTSGEPVAKLHASDAPPYPELLALKGTH
jgi:hypothetical protein